MAVDTSSHACSHDLVGLGGNGLKRNSRELGQMAIRVIRWRAPKIKRRSGGGVYTIGIILISLVEFEDIAGIRAVKLVPQIHAGDISRFLEARLRDPSTGKPADVVLRLGYEAGRGLTVRRVANPRSVWQWGALIALSIVGTLLIRLAMIAPYGSGRQ